MQTTRHASRKLALFVVAGAVGTLGVITGASVASAAPPVFVSAPDDVYTAPGTSLAFSGVDPVSLVSRDVVFTTSFDDSSCVIPNPGDEGSAGDCVTMHLSLTDGAINGTLTIEDSAVGYVGPGRSGDADFTVVGTQVNVQGAITSLVYTVPTPTFETSTAKPVKLNLEVANPNSESADALIRVHVHGGNDAPVITVPSGSPFQVPMGGELSFAEPGEIFHVDDVDIPMFGPNVEQVHGYTWVDCGSLSFTGPDPQMYGWPFGDPAMFATPNEIPPEIPPALPWASSFDHAPAVAWSASLNVFNYVLSEVAFHAPNAVLTCTLTIVVNDLGFNAMPLPGEIADPLVAAASVEFEVVEPPAATTSTTSTTEPPICPTTTTSNPPVTTTEPPGDATTTTAANTTTTTVGSTTTTERETTTTTLPPTTTTEVIDTTTTTQPQRTTTTTSPTNPTTTTQPQQTTTTTIPGVPPGITFGPTDAGPSGFARSRRPVQADVCVPDGHDPGDPGDPIDSADPGTSGDSGTLGGTLPATGADPVTLGVVAGLLVVSGAVLVSIRRRT